jgi:hypothetical protein
MVHELEAPFYHRARGVGGHSKSQPNDCVCIITRLSLPARSLIVAVVVRARRPRTVTTAAAIAFAVAFTTLALVTWSPAQLSARDCGARLRFFSALSCTPQAPYRLSCLSWARPVFRSQDFSFSWWR